MLPEYTGDDFTYYNSNNDTIYYVFPKITEYVGADLLNGSAKVGLLFTFFNELSRYLTTEYSSNFSPYKPVAFKLTNPDGTEVMTFRYHTSVNLLAQDAVTDGRVRTIKQMITRFNKEGFGSSISVSKTVFEAVLGLYNTTVGSDVVYLTFDDFSTMWQRVETVIEQSYVRALKLQGEIRPFKVQLT